MPLFRVEVVNGDGSAGDTLEVEAVSAEAAAEIAGRRAIVFGPGWSVVGVVAA